MVPYLADVMHFLCQSLDVFAYCAHDALSDPIDGTILTDFKSIRVQAPRAPTNVPLCGYHVPGGVCQTTLSKVSNLSAHMSTCSVVDQLLSPLYVDA